MKKKYVVLEGLKAGNRFFTINTGDDPTKLVDGTVAYKVIDYAATSKEAQSILYPTKEAEEAALRVILLTQDCFATPIKSTISWI